MKTNKAIRNSRFIEALEYIDPKIIAEVAEGIKAPELTSSPLSKEKALKKSFKQIAALAACALLLGVLIPIGHYTAIKLSSFAPAATVAEAPDITFYRKVARRTLDNGWIYTFVREGFKDGDDSKVYKYTFYGINVKYKYAEKYGGVSSEQNLDTGWLLFSDCSDAETRDAELISSILSNDKTDEELLALDPDDFTFESLDKNIFFELMREALTGEPQAEGTDLNYWDKPHFAFLEEQEYLEGYKYQISFLNETGLIDELFIDVLYKTGEGEMDYVQLSDLVASGNATEAQIKVYDLIQSMVNDIKENTSYIYNGEYYRNKIIGEIEFSRLYDFLEDIHNNCFDEYIG